MYAYFDRDNVALRGLAKYFRKVSKEEREHAEGLMDFQNRRGGRVILQSVPAPLTDFNHVEKGDALNVRIDALVAPARLALPATHPVPRPRRQWSWRCRWRRSTTPS